MWCRVVLVVGLLAARTLCEDEEEVKDLRAAKEFDLDGFRADDNEKWHAVDYHQHSEDWIPSPQTSTDEEPVMKRRRPGRKRKRRPQTTERDIYPDEDRLPSRPRPRRPQRLDTRRENWREEMLAEEPFRPIRNYSRRRQYPKYDDEEDVQDDGPKPTDSVEKIRDPYTALNQDQGRRRQYKRKHLTDELQTEPVTEKEVDIATDRVDISPNPTDLKTLLKQSGGISLSELLQQRNLSLADLLKGEQHAISALTSIPEQTSEPYEHDTRYQKDRKHNSGQRRLPPVRKYTRTNDNDFTTTRENLSQKNYFSSINDEFKQSEIETESATDRRIFVPSHPKYYTSVDYKPNIMKDLNIDKTTSSISTTTSLPEQTSESISIISSTVTFSTSENPTVKIKNQIKSRPRFTLPPTYAKLKNLAAKTTMKSIINNETENYPKISIIPSKAIKIDINELFGVPKIFNNNEVITTSTTTTEGPMKISVDLDQIFEKSIQNENSVLPKVTMKNEMKDKEEIQSENFDAENERVKELSAKDEIMEILSDSVSRENLTRLLELRNMTLEELVEQRERGSSQRHLADIFHNKTKEPEPSEETIVDQIIKTDENLYDDAPSIFDTFPKFENRPDNNIPSDSIKQSHYYSSIMELPTKTRESRENQFASRDSDEYNVISNPIYRTTTGKSNEIIGKIIPVWRQAYTKMQNNNQRLMLPDKFLDDDLIIKDEAQRIEEIENKLAEAVNGALNIDVLNHKTYEDDDEENEFFRLPYGVQSAIIASAVIIGISLLVFLTIFIIFKWTQRRQRKHLTYTNSFSSSKIKTPILETPYQRRIFGTIMNATLGRKKKIPTISCREPQSIQEYLWETDRKPYQ